MASYRREGSSRFGANNRWGDFWAVGGGVNIGDLVDLAFLNNLKLRVGYGVTGNLPRENYAYLTTLGAVGLGYIGGDFVPAIQPTSNPNPDLKWEEKGEFNVGLDFAILDFKLSGSLDYFKRNTKDLLNTISVASPPNLFGSSLVNLGELESNGFEMQLNYLAIQTSDFRWDITATFATNETKLVKFNNDDQVSLLRGEGVAQNGSYAALVEEGKPLGQIISPTFVGYSDIGAPLFLDPDGNPTDDNQLAELRTIQGNGFPDFTAGLATSLSYKGLDFNLFLRSAIGHEIANGRRARYEHPAYVGIQNVVITEETTTEDKGQLIWHSKFVETASFLMLDNVTIGYTIPLPKSEAFRNLRIYLTGERLFTITNYLGSDPEVRYIDRGRGISRTPGFNGNPQYGGDILVAGMDRWENGHYPARTFTIGVNVGF
jgi:iron complex outermembrane receptor protein